MIKKVGDHIAQLGEGPVWDEQTNTIYWIDIAKGEIICFNTINNHTSVFPLGQMPGAIALCGNNNQLLAAAKNGPGILDLKTREFNQFPFPEDDKPGNRFNDGKVDAGGRFWVGTTAVNEEHQAGGLYAMNADFLFQLKLPALTIPNGMAWSHDQRKFFFIDTPARQVMAYDFDLNTGNLSNERIAFSFPDEDGFPDGMTIDTEGMLWIAHWDGWQVSRWNPGSGEKILSVKLPVARVTSCTFGGTEMNDLYITTAWDRLSTNQKKEQPEAGALFVWKNSPYKGVMANRFYPNLISNK